MQRATRRQVVDLEEHLFALSLDGAEVVLNDRFRQTFNGGRVVATAGFMALDEATRLRIFIAVQAFAAFDEGNDPWGEHDFGQVEVSNKKVYWKIDYYNPTLTAGSENPANEGETHRVLTIMLPSEY